jgi:hypothetical protein
MTLMSVSPRPARRDKNDIYRIIREKARTPKKFNAKKTEFRGSNLYARFDYFEKRQLSSNVGDFPNSQEQA